MLPTLDRQVLIVLLVFAMLLSFCGSISATQVVLTSGDLPYSASSGDTISLSGSHITSNTDGITMNGVNNVVINLGTDTLEFGAAGGNRNEGIRIQNSFDIWVNGGLVLRDQGPGQAAGSVNACVMLFSDFHDITFTDVDLTIDGHDAQCVIHQEPNNYYNVLWDGGTWTSNSTSFTSRHSYDGAVYYSWAGSDNQIGDYDVRIHKVTIANGPAQGIIVNGRFIIDSCNITVDHVNTGPSGSNANQYSILFGYGGGHGGSHVFGNTITSGTSRGGSRGIMLENLNAPANDPVLIYDNFLDLHCGPDAENSGGVLRGIRVRTMDGNVGAGRLCTYGYIYSNTVVVTADNDAGTSAYGNEVNGIQFECVDDAGWVVNNIKVDSNVIYARAMTSGCNVKAVEVAYEGAGLDTAGTSFSYNTIYTSGTGIRGADEYNGAGCKDMNFHHNIFNQIDTAANDSFVIYNPRTLNFGVSGRLSTGNIGIDNTYNDAMTESNPTFAGTANIVFKRTLKISVMGNNGLLINDAAVTVDNNYGETVLSTSSTNGVASGLVSYRFEKSGTGDSTNFNDFSVSVSKNGESNQSVLTVGADNNSVTISLNQAGTVIPGLDPLSNVDDFSAIMTANNFSNNLDSFRVSFGTGSNSAPDSVIYCYSLSAYPDSAGANRKSFEFSTNTGYTYNFSLNVIDPDTLYFSYWTKSGTDPEAQWSSRGIDFVPVMDVIPPARIDSLKADTGSSLGQIDFRWRAPGDNGRSGQASYYQIRYALESVTENSFGSDSVYSNPPTPSFSGQFDSISISNLTPGQRYFFGIKAFDAADNSSELAVASGFARGILPPGLSSDSVLVDTLTGEVTLYAQTVPSYLNLYYEFSLDTDTNFNFAQIVIDSNSNSMASAIFTDLTTEERYFWRCRARADNDSEVSPWSAIGAFDLVQLATDIPEEGSAAADVIAYAYPNPVHFAQSEQVTFVLPDDPSDLSIRTVSGALVRAKGSVSTEWIWDGRNSSGIIVAPGVYLWYLEGTGMHGKIVVQP